MPRPPRSLRPLRQIDLYLMCYRRLEKYRLTGRIKDLPDDEMWREAGLCDDVLEDNLTYARLPLCAHTSLPLWAQAWRVDAAPMNVGGWLRLRQSGHEPNEDTSGLYDGIRYKEDHEDVLIDRD